MKRRVAIARAALYGGDLLLLDEAFKGLDGETKTAAMDYVLRCAAGKSILCITHDETVAARFGGRQIRMEPLEPCFVPSLLRHRRESNRGHRALSAQMNF